MKKTVCTYTAVIIVRLCRGISAAITWNHQIRLLWFFVDGQISESAGVLATYATNVFLHLK